jgi:HD superfamily phosphohydrolase
LIQKLLFEVLIRKLKSESKMQKVTKNCPIHGEIALSHLSAEIIASPEFQRLREVHQLGFVHYIYRTAQNHTRFDHCIGVAYLARVAGERFAKKIGLDERDLDLLEIAGLIHDIGHGPFSHSFEMMCGTEAEKHEDRSCRLFQEILQQRESEGIELMKHDEVDFVCSLVSEVEFKGDEKLQRIQKFCKNVISSGFDVDRLDYVYRDLYYLDRSAFAEFVKISPVDLLGMTELRENKLIVPKECRARFEEMRKLLYTKFYFDKKVLMLESMVLDNLVRSKVCVEASWTDSMMMQAACERGIWGVALRKIIRYDRLDLLQRIEGFYNEGKKISPMAWE